MHNRHGPGPNARWEKKPPAVNSHNDRFTIYAHMDTSAPRHTDAGGTRPRHRQSTHDDIGRLRETLGNLRVGSNDFGDSVQSSLGLDEHTGEMEGVSQQSYDHSNDPMDYSAKLEQLKSNLERITNKHSGPGSQLPTRRTQPKPTSKYFEMNGLPSHPLGDRSTLCVPRFTFQDQQQDYLDLRGRASTVQMHSHLSSGMRSSMTRGARGCEDDGLGYGRQNKSKNYPISNKKSYAEMEPLYDQLYPHYSEQLQANPYPNRSKNPLQQELHYSLLSQLNQSGHNPQPKPQSRTSVVASSQTTKRRDSVSSAYIAARGKKQSVYGVGEGPEMTRSRSKSNKSLSFGQNNGRSEARSKHGHVNAISEISAAVPISLSKPKQAPKPRSPTYSVTAQYHIHRAPITQVLQAFHSDEEDYFLSCSLDYRVSLTPLFSSVAPMPLYRHRGAVTSMVLADRTLCTVGRDLYLKYGRLGLDNQSGRFRMCSEGMHRMTSEPTGLCTMMDNKIGVACRDRLVLYDTERQEPIAEISMGQGYELISSGGLAYVGTHSSLSLVDTRQKSPLLPILQGSHVSRWHMHPQQRICVAQQTHSLLLHDLRQVRARTIPTATLPPSEEILSSCWSPTQGACLSVLTQCDMGGTVTNKLVAWDTAQQYGLKQRWSGGEVQLASSYSIVRGFGGHYLLGCKNGTLLQIGPH